MTDTLEFPTISATELVTPATSALDLDKLDLSTLALSKFNPVRKQLTDATKTLTGTVHDLSTQAKVDDAKSLRQRLINAPLADARKVSKGLKSKLKSVSDDVGAELEQIEAGFTEAAKLITPQIDAREAELAAEKAAREAKEAARRQEFEDKVAGIRNYLTLAQGLPSPRIEKGVTFLTAMVVGDEWAEFKPIAQKALDETLASLRALLAKVQAEEVAAAERERIAAENARLKAENERIVAELAAQRVELQRQQDEFAARQLAAVSVPEPVKEDPLTPEPTISEVIAKMEDDQFTTGTGFARVSVDDAGEVKVENVPARDLYVVSFDDVVRADPDEEGATTMLGGGEAIQALVAHIAKAFDTKFPSQPKPSIEWWAELKRLAREVAA